MTKSRGIRVPRGTRAAWVKANQGKHFCGCGCGEVIPLVPVHFNTGVPQFVHGHNNRGRALKPKPPAALCECGCREYATPGRRFVAGHNNRGQQRSAATRALLREAKLGAANPQYGKHPHNYKGGRRKAHGYIQVSVPEHPFGGKKGVVMEHRLVMETHLREHEPTSPFLVEVDGALYLRPEVDVHHLYGPKDDNRLQNLKPMWTKDHRALHHEELIEASRQARLAKTHCPSGHPLSGDNLYVVAKTGARQCRTCRRSR